MKESINSDPKESMLKSNRIKSTVIIVIVEIFNEIILIVRVGGGYISVEEFLDIYTPIELEKMLKNSKNFKIFLFKLIVFRPSQCFKQKHRSQ